MAPPTVVVAMRCGPPSELPQAASAVPGGRRAAPCACREAEDFTPGSVTLLLLPSLSNLKRPVKTKWQVTIVLA